MCDAAALGAFSTISYVHREETLSCCYLAQLAATTLIALLSKVIQLPLQVFLEMLNVDPFPRAISEIDV